MLRVTERDGEKQRAHVMVAAEGVIPFKIDFPPYADFDMVAKVDWRPHKGYRQLFEVRAYADGGILAAVNCILLKSGLRRIREPLPHMSDCRKANGTVHVSIVDNDHADASGGLNSQSRGASQSVFDEPIGVEVDLYDNGLVAEWNPEGVGTRLLYLDQGVSLLIGAQQQLLGVRVDGLSESQIVDVERLSS